MWKLIFGGVTEIFKSWINMKKAKHEAEARHMMKMAESEAEWDLVAMRNAKYSWKDEIITLVWFSPLVVAWFYPAEAQAWVDWVSQLPYFYQIGMFGIIAASFGLRWFFKNKQLVQGNKNGKS